MEGIGDGQATGANKEKLSPELRSMSTVLPQKPISSENARSKPRRVVLTSLTRRSEDNIDAQHAKFSSCVREQLLAKNDLLRPLRSECYYGRARGHDDIYGCMTSITGKIQDFLASLSTRSKLQALSSTFNLPGGLSYCIGGATRWLEQLFSVVAALLHPPNGKHVSLNALVVWFILAIFTPVSAGHVTHQDAATSGSVEGEASVSYCHHKWGCLEITLGVAAVVALCGVCCRNSLRACAQRVRARHGGSANRDNGAVLPHNITSGTDATLRRGMYFSCMILWWTGDFR